MDWHIRQSLDLPAYLTALLPDQAGTPADRLSPSQRLTLVVLWCRAVELADYPGYGLCLASQRELVTGTGLSARHLRRILDELQPEYLGYHVQSQKANRVFVLRTKPLVIAPRKATVYDERSWKRFHCRIDHVLRVRESDGQASESI